MWPDRRVRVLGLATVAALVGACSHGAGPSRSAPTSTVAGSGPSTSSTSSATASTDADLPPVQELTVVLGRPTDRSVTASVLAPADADVTITWGAAPGATDGRVGPVHVRASRPENLELTGLRADTAYTYRAVVGGVAQGEHTFHTQRAPGSTFTFTIDADPHGRDPKFDGDVFAATLANVVADHPDFHVNLGDTFMTEKARPQTVAEAATTFTDMRHFFGAMGTDVPLYLVNGNHEGELGWLLPRASTRNLPVWSTQLRQRYYPNPLPGGFYTGGSTPDAYLGSVRDGYYAWTWGDAQFIVLDPFWYTSDKPASGVANANWGWTLGRAQYDWLRATLDASRATRTFVFVHHLVGGSDEARGGIEVAGFAEWGGRNADGSDGFAAHRPGWGVPIHRLLVDHHVTAVFHGHDHVFVDQELDGIVYQEVPQSSVAEYDNTRIATDYGYVHGDVLGSSGHLRVTVTPTATTIDYVRAFARRDERPGRRNGQVDHHRVVPVAP